MPFCRKCLIILFCGLSAYVAAPHPQESIAARAADNNDEKFSVAPAASYQSHQKIAGVTIAAVVYETDKATRTAFGKLNPNKHGVLPVLVVMENNSGQTLNLESLRVEYVRPDRRRIEATPAREIPYLHGPQRPNIQTSPLPRRGRKNPLDIWEIPGRAFAARMLPQGESASGFFYFQTAHSHGAKAYITRIFEAPTGKELFYFEIPLEKAPER